MTEETPPETKPEEATEPDPSEKEKETGKKILMVVTLLCFVFLYWKLHGAAAREGMSLVDYMVRVFAAVAWGNWLALMIAYSVLFFLIDTMVARQALKWFIADIPYTDILPVRASAYVISLFNEQIGKGAMALYLRRGYQIPGWEVTSVMFFIMFCEVFYLLVWATLGYFFSAEKLPAVFGLIPWLALAGAAFLVVWIGYFRGRILPRSKVRDRSLLHAFRHAQPWHYAMFFVLRSPALIAAMVVYTAALNLFGVEASLATIWPYLPVIFFAAAVPTPMRAIAITAWVLLFPENEGQMAAFGFVQHNFFILFNAVIGLAFWPRVRRDLFPKK